MKYYIQDRPAQGDNARTAFSKARSDAESICAGEGWRPLSVWSEGADYADAGLWRKLRGHFSRRRDWAEALAPLGAGDLLFLQLPILYNCVFLPGVLRRARRRGVRVIALVHDLEVLRMCLEENVSRKTRLRMRLEETGALGQCDRLIVHNDPMAALLAEQGLPRERMIPLGIFDYLMPDQTERAVEERPPSADRALAVAGNLSPDKAGYIYHTPPEVILDLYGVKYAGGDLPHRYHGSFPPDELPARLETGFGLVWDGPSAETCEGVYGAYLRYNDPHKTSLYLASGLPVVIWEKAALAELIRRENAGLTAASVAEGARMAAQLPTAAYSVMRDNAASLGKRLRKGAFLRAALTAAEASPAHRPGNKSVIAKKRS